MQHLFRGARLPLTCCGIVPERDVSGCSGMALGDDALDAIISGLNMLGEELEHAQGASGNAR